MSESGDLDNVLPHIVPDNLADQVIKGRVESDVPNELAPVAGLFLAARQAGSTAELAGEDAAVAAFAGAIAVAMAPTSLAAWRSRVPRQLTGRTAIIAAAVTLATAGAAAAATGTIPTPFHSSGHSSESTATTSTTLTPVTVTTVDDHGVDIPRTTVDDHGVDISAISVDDHGNDGASAANAVICAAWFSAGKPQNPDPILFKDLIAASSAVNAKVQDFCDDAKLDGTGTSVDDNGGHGSHDTTGTSVDDHGGSSGGSGGSGGHGADDPTGTSVDVSGGGSGGHGADDVTNTSVGGSGGATDTTVDDSGGKGKSNP